MGGGGRRSSCRSPISRSRSERADMGAVHRQQAVPAVRCLQPGGAAGTTVPTAGEDTPQWVGWGLIWSQALDSDIVAESQ